MRVLNVGAGRRLSAVASLCTVGLVVSSCGMVTITPKNAGEPTAGTLTGLPSPVEMQAREDRPQAGAFSPGGRSVGAMRALLTACVASVGVGGFIAGGWPIDWCVRVVVVFVRC